MSELVKALRDAYEETDTVYFHLRTIIKDAADTIDRLTAENARLDAELGRCTSGNGTYISLESHDRILAKLTAELLQKTQQLTETNKTLESDNYNAAMNLSRLTERLGMAESCITQIFNRVRRGGIEGGYPFGATTCIGYDVYKIVAQWRGEESE